MLTGKYNPLTAFAYVEEKYGLRTADGKRHNKTTIYRTLRNTFYYGEFEFPLRSGNVYIGKHESMITKQEFRKVQGYFVATNKKIYETDLKKLFPFKGPLYCGECESPMTAERKRRITCECKYRFSGVRNDVCPKCKTDLADMKGHKVEERIYYSCTKNKNKKCSQKVYTPERVENSITEFLGNFHVAKNLVKISLKA
jgi:hypothetical protein